MNSPAANDNRSDNMTADAIRIEAALRAVLADGLEKNAPLDELAGVLGNCLADLFLNMKHRDEAGTACDAIHERMKNYVVSIFSDTGGEREREALRTAVRASARKAARS